jgi:hypothetical protein
MEDMTPEMGEEQMKAWTEWITRVGPALVDVGAPLGARTAICDDGAPASASDQNGYSIVEADGLDAAKALADGHPFLSEGKGRFVIDIFEIVPM